MSSRALLLPLAVVAAAALAACSMHLDVATGSPGTTGTEDRQVSANVTAVDLTTTGTLTLAVGDPSLSVTAGHNVLRDITTDVTGGTLVLGMSSSWLDPGPISYELTLPGLSSVRLSGSGEVSGDIAGTGPGTLDLPGSGRIELSTVAADRLTVDVEGSGEVAVGDVTATSTTVRIGGSGIARLAGRADDLDVRISGSGSVDTAGLTARDAVVAVSGSGSVDVDAERTLDASVTGSGSVSYTGQAQVTRSVTGSGTVSGS
ncbi:MAG TPA: DUF2807 domain-containing protein [Cellulomonas sp.]